MTSSELPSRLAEERSGEVRLISPSGQRTPWLAADKVMMTAEALCVPVSGTAWRYVTAIEVSGLTDANIAAILVDLPREIHVRHRGGGVIELETDGRDLTPWLESAAHDPSDLQPRYRARVWGAWDEPLSWRELPDAAVPMVGWPTAGATAEQRHVSTGASVVVSLLALPVVAIAVGAVMLANVPSPFPGEGPAAEPHETDGERLASFAGDAATRGDAPGTWRPTPCRLAR